jgi:hypothetical protein
MCVKHRELKILLPVRFVMIEVFDEKSSCGLLLVKTQQPDRISRCIPLLLGKRGMQSSYTAEASMSKFGFNNRPSTSRNGE